MRTGLWPLPPPKTTGKGDASGSSGGGGPVTLFRDTFTGVDTTDLALHTPEIGGPWVAAPAGSITIVGNKAVQQSSTTGGYNVNVGTGNYVWTGTLKKTATRASAYVRYLNDSNRWMFYIQATQVDLYERLAGVVVLRATVAVTLDTITTYPFTITVTPTSLAMLINAQTVSYSSAVLAAETRFAIGSDAGGGNQWDDFLIL